MTHICFCCGKMKHPGGIHAVLTVLSKQDGSCLFSQWMQNFSSSCLMETWSAAALQIRAEWNNSCRVCRKPQSQWCAINIYTSVFVSHYSSPPTPLKHTLKTCLFSVSRAALLSRCSSIAEPGAGTGSAHAPGTEHSSPQLQELRCGPSFFLCN